MPEKKTTIAEAKAAIKGLRSLHRSASNPRVSSSPKFLKAVGPTTSAHLATLEGFIDENASLLSIDPHVKEAYEKCDLLVPEFSIRFNLLNMKKSYGCGAGKRIGSISINDAVCEIIAFSICQDGIVVMYEPKEDMPPKCVLFHAADYGDTWANRPEDFIKS